MPEITFQQALMLAVGSLSGALIVLWRHTVVGFRRCEKDRAALWEHQARLSETILEFMTEKRSLS